jgi:integrase
MSVYKRNKFGKIVKNNKEKGVWWYDFQINGRRYKGSIKGAANRKQAEKYEAEKKLEVFEGRYGKPSHTITFEDFVKNVYLKWARQHKRSYKWDEFQAGILCPHFKGKLLREITSADIEDYKLTRREQTTRRGTQRAGSSVNRERALLSVIFTLAVTHGYCETNPCKNVKRFKEDGRRERVLSRDEEVRLIEVLSVKQPDLLPIAIIALGTGMRRGEMIGLEWKDIDFEKGLIYLRAGKTKSGKARVTPMNADVRAALLELHGENRGGQLFPFNPDSISYRFSTLCDQLGMPDVTLHTLRHTFDTRLIERNVNPFVVKELMGHATLAQTNHYSHISLIELQSAVKTLEHESAS